MVNDDVMKTSYFKKLISLIQGKPITTLGYHFAPASGVNWATIEAYKMLLGT